MFAEPLPRTSAFLCDPKRALPSAKCTVVAVGKAVAGSPYGCTVHTVTASALRGGEQSLRTLVPEGHVDVLRVVLGPLAWRIPGDIFGVGASQVLWATAR